MTVRVAINIRKAVMGDEYHVRPSQICECKGAKPYVGFSYHSYGLTSGCIYRDDAELKDFWEGRGIYAFA